MSSDSSPSSDSPQALVDVLVLDGETLHALRVVRSLSFNPRWRIHVLGRVGKRRLKPPIARSVHITAFHNLARRKKEGEEFIKRLLAVVERTGAKIIMPLRETTTLALIEHRAVLEPVARITPLPTAEAFTTATDKFLLARFMAAQGIPHPQTWDVSEAGSDSLRFPLLVKPRKRGGGNGIVKVGCRRELARVLASPGEDALYLQEFVEGADFGCSVLMEEGRLQAWTVQRGRDRPKPYAPFSILQMKAHAKVLASTTALMTALGWSGVAHIDLRMDRRTGQPLILEINGRYWGSLMASLMTGVNFPDLACRITLGEAVLPPAPAEIRFSRWTQWLGDAMRLRPRAFRSQATDLRFFLNDPMPDVIIWRRMALQWLQSLARAPEASRKRQSGRPAGPGPAMIVT
ncbi:MAG: ATP-grasp enzyme-like protein [Rariglobus sp.]|nr:ATP-grasp enzyme-like protein [Rariglobus sp.]